jgi:hypothetical protein
MVQLVIDQIAIDARQTYALTGLGMIQDQRIRYAGGTQLIDDLDILEELCGIPRMRVMRVMTSRSQPT